MTPDELARLKAALTAAGDHLVDAISQVEQATPSADSHSASGIDTPSVTQASASGPGYRIFISSTFIDMERERAAVLTLLETIHMEDHLIGLTGANGKTTLADTLIDFGMAVPVLKYEPTKLDALLEHSLLSFLDHGDTEGLSKFTAAFPADDDHVIEVPAFERADAAVYADSIHAFNGRSLDSHNPWHLDTSFEAFVESCSDESAYPPRKKAAKKAANAEVMNPLVSFMPTINQEAPGLHQENRNKVADTPGHADFLDLQAPEETGIPLPFFVSSSVLSCLVKVTTFHACEDRIVNATLGGGGRRRDRARSLVPAE